VVLKVLQVPKEPAVLEHKEQQVHKARQVLEHKGLQERRALLEHKEQ
jgi:hypothetical protein